MTSGACRTGNAYPSGVPDFTSGFHRGSCCPVICISLFHVLVFGLIARFLYIFTFWHTCICFKYWIDICYF